MYVCMYVCMYVYGIPHWSIINQNKSYDGLGSV